MLQEILQKFFCTKFIHLGKFSVVSNRIYCTSLNYLNFNHNLNQNDTDGLEQLILIVSFLDL